MWSSLTLKWAGLTIDKMLIAGMLSLTFDLMHVTLYLSCMVDQLHDLTDYAPNYLISLVLNQLSERAHNNNNRAIYWQGCKLMMCRAN